MKNKTELTSEIKYRLLKDISHKIRGTLDLVKILNLLLDILETIIDYDAAGIFILKEEIKYSAVHHQKQKIEGIAQRGFGDLPPESDTMLLEGKGIIGLTIKTGESIILRDVTINENYIAGRKQTKSEITSPIFRDGNTIGALNIESDKLNAFSESDIKVLNFFAEAASISIEKALLHSQLLEKEKMEEQLHLAKEIQLGLLPVSDPEIKNYGFASICIPTYEIGGDYFDYIQLDGNRLAVLVADVSGDGIPAALIMAAFRALLRYNAKLYSNPAELMKIMNEHVSEFMRPRDFISVFYGILDYESHNFIYANCGHNPAIFYHLGKHDLLEGTGPSLNLIKDAYFDYNEVKLNNGDRILLYTDGVVEVFSEKKDQYGLDRLVDLFESFKKKSPEDIIYDIITNTRDFSGSEIFNDDFTLLLLERE